MTSSSALIPVRTNLMLAGVALALHAIVLLILPALHATTTVLILAAGFVALA